MNVMSVSLRSRTGTMHLSAKSVKAGFTLVAWILQPVSTKFW